MATANLNPVPGLFNDPEELAKLTSLFTDEIRIMLATLKMSNLGGLSVAECANHRLQSYLFEYFKQRLADEQFYLYTYEVSEPQLNLVKTLSELNDQPRFKNLELTGRYKAIIIFVHGLEKLDDDSRRRFLQLLNFYRDRLTIIPQPVVIWATPIVVNEMARSAPDFWSWKGALFSFPANSDELAFTKQIQLSKAPPLQRYIESILNDSDYSVWADLYLPLKAIRTAETLHMTPSRHTFTDEELSRLSTVITDSRQFESNQIIIEHGDTGTECFVILDGIVEVIIPDTLGNEVVVNRLKRGDFFGEIAMIKNIPRTATIKTVTRCTCLLLTKPTLRAAASRITNLITLINDIAERRFEAITRASPEGMSPLRRFADQGSLLRPVPTDVYQLINEDKRTVILGGAGTGKTTVLRFTTLTLAQLAQQDLANSKPVRLPIYIKLNALSSNQTIEHLILNILQGYGLSEFKTEADVQQLIKGQNRGFSAVEYFIFIMDGLNEIQRDAVTGRLLNRFIKQFADHRFILSCRLQDYLSIKTFRTALLQQLTRRDIETFLVKYIGEERGQKVAGEIHSDVQLMDLAQTPLALYMFTQITKHGTESLPKNRGILFNRFTENLLERIDSEWWKMYGRSRSKTPLWVRKGVLANLGILMQEEQALTCPRDRWIDLIAQQIQQYKQQATPELLETIRYTTLEDIHEEIKFSGLIRYGSSTERGWVEFAHHTYQEFFAALSLQSTNRPLEDLINTPESLRHWHGAIVLLYGIAQNRIELYSQILGNTDNYARIWLASQCLANSGEEIALATERFSRQLPQNQQFAMLFSVGLASYHLNRYPETLTYLLGAAEKQPGNAEVQYELGSLYRQLDQYERAINHLEEAIHLRPDFVDAYNQLGITYYDQKKYEEALTVFSATTQLEPNNAHHYFNLGTVQKILKDYRAAHQTFQTVVQLKPDYVEARLQLEILDKALTSGVVQVLKSIPMLSKLTLEQSILLAGRLKESRYMAGDIIYHMGEMGDSFYIIEAGQVQVLTPELSEETPGNRELTPGNILKTGGFFGEIALIRTVPRTSTIRCVTDTHLLSLSRQDFKDIVEHYPSIAHQLAETSGYRLLQDRQTGRQVKVSNYYDPSYLEQVISQQNEVTVVMGDIHGSTFLTHDIGPELMLDFLDDYLLRMSTLVVNAGGAMDKSLGDSVMGVFGKYPDRPGESAASPALRALFATLQMRQAYVELREEWKTKSATFMKTGMGIGISTGPVSIGTAGTDGVMVGAVVNLSNKLSKMAIKGRDECEVYIDQRTYDILGDNVEVEKLDPDYVLSKSSGVKLDAYRIIRNQKLAQLYPDRQYPD